MRLETSNRSKFNIFGLLLSSTSDKDEHERKNEENNIRRQSYFGYTK